MDTGSFYGRPRREQPVEHDIVNEEIYGESTVIELDSDGEASDSENEANLEEGHPDIQPGPSNRKKQRKSGTPWRIVQEAASERAKPVWKGRLPMEPSVRNPIEYFRDFMEDTMLCHIVEQSNLYAIQKNSNESLNMDKNELEQFIASLFLMSMMKISNTRLYWSDDFDFRVISNIFSRNRWEFIKSCLHCNNNDNIVPRDDPNYDPLFKVRPLLSHFQNKFRNIAKPQMLCVDEQIVPFKGKSQLKQYIPSKPHKWGFKIFALCDNSGILHDFSVYTGKIIRVEDEPDLGASSNIVLQLAKYVPIGMNHLLYFDNWFTSIPLVTHLASKEIYCLGTARMNRIPRIQSSVTSDKMLLKKGRGSHCEDIELRLVKWADNRCVNLLSSFASASPTGDCNRYDKKKKEVVTIPCPSIVLIYNSFMGGVDLMDALLALYRINVRSKKFYHKLIFNFLDVSIVNSWLLYRRDCDSWNVPVKDRYDLQHFKLSVAKSLLMEGKQIRDGVRVGRPSNVVEKLHSMKKVRGNRSDPIPEKPIRTDGLHHWPSFQEAQNRCKMPNCAQKTYNKNAVNVAFSYVLLKTEIVSLNFT